MSLEDRVRDEFQAEGARLIPGSADVASVMRRGTRRRVAERAVVGVVVLAAMAGPLTLLQDPGPGPSPIASNPTTVSTSPPTETLGPPEARQLPGLVAAGPAGIVRLRDGEVTERLEVGPIMLALDDLDGGYIIQVGVSASSILRLPSGAAEMTELIAPQANEILRLYETAIIDGSPAVAYTVRTTDTDPEATREELRVYFLDTGDTRVIAQVGDYESGPSRVSYAGVRFLFSMHAEGTTWFEFVAPDGSGIDLPASPRPKAAAQDDFLVWVGHGGQAPDGKSMAFLRGSPRSEAPFDLVAVDLDTGTEIAVVRLEGARHDNVTRLDWDGQVAVVSFTDRPALVVSADGTVTSLDISGTIAMTP